MGREHKLRAILDGIAEEFKREGDVGGSYTGNPEGGGQPVQDADDL